MFNHYLNPYNPQQFNAFQPQQNILPPQQIPQAKGKDSIDMLRMSPNSSVLIADETAPIVWKCTSDSLGNVTAQAFDISPHKDEEQKAQENLSIVVTNLDERLKKLEGDYESIIKRYQSSNEEHKSDKANVADAKRQSTGNKQTDGK